MTWSRAFPEPFVLADGRKIKTLYEAGQLVLALPERHRTNGHWQSAMERLMAAAEDVRHGRTLLAKDMAELEAMASDGEPG